MKRVIFVRGPESDRRRALVRMILSDSTIHRVGMIGSELDAKTAYKQAIREARVAFDNPTITSILIDNESLLPLHWTAFSKHVDLKTALIGIDVFDDSVEFRDKTNLQYQNCAAFIAILYKYHCVKSDDDLDDVLESLRKFNRQE